MARTRAQENRALRQAALREQLENKGLVQKVLEDADKIAELDRELEPNEVNRLKVASELRMKLINKYLPDLKSTELTGDPDSPIQTATSVTFVGVGTED